MKGLKKLLFSAMLLVGLTATQASAVTYDLTNWLSANPVPLGASLGTVTLTDNAGDIDVTVDLNTGLNLLSFYLNYNGASFTNPAITGASIQYDLNDLKADGYSAGMFDIVIPDNGTLSATDYFFGTISADQTLSVSDFDVLDTSGMFHVAVHMGDGETDLLDPWTDEGSIWVADGDSPPVPEPGTMILLGTGLLGLAIYGKRRRSA